MTSRCRLHSTPLHNNNNHQKQVGQVQAMPMQMQIQTLVQELVKQMPVRVMQATLMQMRQLMQMQQLIIMLKISKMVRAAVTLVPELEMVLVARPLLEVNH